MTITGWPALDYLIFLVVAAMGTLAILAFVFTPIVAVWNSTDRRVQVLAVIALIPWFAVLNRVLG